VAVRAPEEPNGEELGVHRLLALELAGELRERLLLLGAIRVRLQLLRPCIEKAYGVQCVSFQLPGVPSAGCYITTCTHVCITSLQARSLAKVMCMPWDGHDALRNTRLTREALHPRLPGLCIRAVLLRILTQRLYVRLEDRCLLVTRQPLQHLVEHRHKAQRRCLSSDVQPMRF
jgi:hypothetical protein